MTQSATNNMDGEGSNKTIDESAINQDAGKASSAQANSTDGEDAISMVTDQEIMDLADDIESDAHVQALGVALKRTRSEMNQYTSTSVITGMKTCAGVRNMLFTWRQTIKPRDQRSVLKGALMHSGLVMLAEQFFPEVPEIQPDKNDSSDSLLINLANEIETEHQMRDLGRELGFRESDMTRFQTTNNMEGVVTSRGTCDMLFEWRQHVTSGDLPGKLKEALLRAGLHFLASRHFAEVAGFEGPNMDRLSSKVTAISYLRKQLIENYKSVVCKIQRRPWDPYDIADLSNLFTSVILHVIDRRTGECLKEELPGSVDDIFGVKVNNIYPKRIVVVASAGRGKTCAVAKLAYNWTYQVENSPMNDIPLFFALRLRAVEEKASLGEALLSEPLGYIQGVTPESLEDFIGRHEEDCAMALDGYDEYNGTLSSNASSNSVVSTMSNKRYRNCRTVVTTRSYLEKDFQESDLARSYVKMELEGFSKSQAISCTEKYFKSKSNPEEAQRLQTFLRDNMFLKELIKVPLFCIMVCHLWEENMLEHVSTRGTLFEAIVHFLLAHAVSKDETFECDLLKLLRHLGKIALDGIQADRQKVVFDDDAFADIRDHESDGIRLGIISKQTYPVRHFTGGKTCKTYVEFFHKMAQEYSAAMFLSHSPCALVNFCEDLGSSPSPLKFGNVCRFLAGSPGKPQRAVLLAISRLSQEQIPREEKHTFLLNCFSESDGMERSSKLPPLFEEGKLDLWSPMKYSTIKGLERLPLSVKDHITTLNLTLCHLPEHLTEQLWSNLSSLLNLREARIFQCALPAPPRGELAQLSVRSLTIGQLHSSEQHSHLIASAPALERLMVESSPNTDNLQQTIIAVLKGLRGSQKKGLQALTISGCHSKMPRWCATDIATVLESQASSLQELQLFEISADEKGLKSILNSTRTMPKMRKIVFEKCGTQGNGDLMMFLNRHAKVGQTDDMIEVIVKTEYRRGERAFYLSRLDEPESIYS